MHVRAEEAVALSKMKKRIKNNDDMNSLSHTRWNCQCHIVFTPK